MARNKIGLHFKGYEDYMAKLDEIGGSEAMKRGVEGALKAAKQYVTTQLDGVITPSNLPAQGKYSQGDTRKALDTDLTVFWDGTEAHVKVGFDFKKGGLTSIFLMYGTPKMQPVAGLKAAIYGAKTKKQIGEIEAEEINKVISQIMRG